VFKLIDAYTFNFAYIGSRWLLATVVAGFLLAGPGWKGETPKAVERSDSLRTESFSPHIARSYSIPAHRQREKVQAGL